MITALFSGSRRAALLAMALLVTSAARAQQPVDDASRNAARDLAHRGSDAYARGDYKTAQDLFSRSYKLVPAPTLSLREARALEKLGRLVEAAEAYVRTARTPVHADSPPVFAESVQVAQEELAQLRPRIPRLKIVLSGEAAGDPSLEVKLDGRPVSAALIGVETPVNPGQHELTALTSSGATASSAISLAEGEVKSTVLELQGGVAAPAARSSTALGPMGAGDATVQSDSDQKTWAYVAFGVGGVGLGVGFVTGLLAVGKHADAKESCPNGQCLEGSAGADDVESFRALRTISTIGYVTGILGAGAGVALLLTAPKARPATARSITPFVGLGSAGVSGRF